MAISKSTQYATNPKTIPVSFDTVQEMVDYAFLEVGDKVRTLGYYAPGDGGGNDYEIVAAGTGTDDGGSLIDLGGSGHQAKGLFPFGVNVQQFGATSGVDCTSKFQAALDLGFFDVFVPTPSDNGIYHITQITVPAGVTLRGDAADGAFQNFNDFDFTSESSLVSCLKAIGTLNTPLVILEERAAVRDLRLVDLRQKREVTTLDEAWNDTQHAVQIGRSGKESAWGQTVDNIACIGFTKLVTQYYSGSGAPAGGRNITISRLQGMPFDVGVEILFTSDICWARDCQFITASLEFSGWIQGDVDLYRRNLARSVTGWKLGRADGFQLFGCQAFAVKYFLHSFKDSFETDNNIGGGFNAVNCPIDICGVGYRMDRTTNNAIGGNVVGGQIIPNIVLPGGEENTAIQLNTVGSSRVSFSYSMVGVSVHDGGANSSTPVTGDYTGASSVKTPSYIADFTNATETALNVANSRLVCLQPEIVDYAVAYANGNKFSASGCIDADQLPINRRPSGRDGNADTLIVLDGETIAEAEVRQSDGTRIAKDVYSSALRTHSTSGTMELRAGGVGSGFQAVQLAPNGNLYPVANASQNIGQASNRWSIVFSDEIRMGANSTKQVVGAGSPEGVVTAPPGSTYQNTNGGTGTSFYVKESGTGNTGWVAK